MPCVLVVLVLSQVGRVAVPDAASLKEAEKVVREAFAAEYAKGAIPERAALARTLLRQGRETRGDPLMKYVLLREARDVAVRAGDGATVVEAVHEMGLAYEVEPLGMKHAFLVKAAKAIPTPDEAAFAKLHHALGEESMLADNYDVASAALTGARTHAIAAGDEILARVEARLLLAKELKASYARVRKARETLAKQPNDSGANATVGLFLCLVKDQWEPGLAMLRQAGDKDLQRLAELEQRTSKETATFVELGDGWWRRSESESGAYRAGARNRGLGWYEKALANLQGAARVRVSARVLEWRRERGGGWENVTEGKFWNQSATPMVLHGVTSNSYTVKLAPFLPGEFDAVRVRYRLGPDRKDPGLGLILDDDRWIAMIGKDHVACLHRDGGRGAWKQDESVPVGAKDSYTLEVAIVKGQYVVSVDGVERIRKPSTLASIADVMIHAQQCVATIEEVQLRYRR